ncbi:helix-turn-helix domain-containing protein [Cryptosporangium japonicum]|uniref:PucR C-terminal helix-turn-helix domain-containing protein n=1 Tax=Cryptosporangium japonicum TaxID=80872 RepID=A0ABP3ETG9_9ACTN
MPESDESRSLSDRARVRRLIDALDRDTVTDAVLQALRASRGLDGHAPTEPRAGNPRWTAVPPLVRDHVRMFTRMLHSGEQPTRAELRALVRQAAAASQSPVEELLRSYRIAAEAASRAVRAAAGAEDLAAVVTVTEEMMAYVNLTTAAIVQASLDDRDLRRSERERRFRRLFDALDGAAALTADLVELADDIGLPTTGPYLPFTAAQRGAGAGDHARLAAELTAAGGVLAFSEGTRIDGICRSPSALEWLTGLDEVAVAVGPAASRGRLGAACHDLHVVIEVAVRHGRTGTIGLADFAPEVLVELSPEVSDALTARVYDPLPEDLRTTLHALVAYGFDRTSTAATLHIHRNTLLYRLGRIEERLGLDLSRAADQVAIYLATLRHDRVRESTPPAPETPSGTHRTPPAGSAPPGLGPPSTSRPRAHAVALAANDHAGVPARLAVRAGER